MVNRKLGKEREIHRRDPLNRDSTLLVHSSGRRHDAHCSAQHLVAVLEWSADHVRRLAGTAAPSADDLYGFSLATTRQSSLSGGFGGWSRSGIPYCVLAQFLVGR